MMRSVLAHFADVLRACRGGWEVDTLEKYQSGGCWNNQMGGRSRAVAEGTGGGDTRESSFCSQFCLPEDTAWRRRGSGDLESV